jgi:hypothetical protein
MKRLSIQNMKLVVGGRAPIRCPADLPSNCVCSDRYPGFPVTICW